MRTAQILFLVACLLIAAGPRMGLAQGTARVAAPDTSCWNPHIRNTGRALLCGRVVDSVSGQGVGGGLNGGSARFVRVDGVEMNGPIRADGSFSLNVAGGHGTLTLRWSCRGARVIADTITLAPGTGQWREFRVAADAADTLCRVREERTPSSAESGSRWLSYGPCLRISYGAWEPTLGPEYPVSRWLRLESAPDRQARPGSIQPFQDSLGVGTRWRMRGWRAIRGDSLEFAWSTGFAAVTITLGVSGDSLVGSGLWTFDVINTDSLGFIDTSGLPRARVTAHPAPCG
jgi:hypothetical protein